MEQENLESLNGFYATIIDGYRQALESNPQMYMSDFCKIKNVDLARVTHWANHHNLSLTQIKREVQFKKGLIASPNIEKRPRDIYAEAWEDYQSVVRKGNNITLMAYCTLHNVNGTRMDKWLRRNNLSVTDFKNKLGLTTPTETESTLNPQTKSRLGRVLQQYKAALADNPDCKFRQFCRDKQVDYECMSRFMSAVGVTVRQLKQSAILENKCPRKRRNVFVQFKPNGGTDGDRLVGVKIQTPDGSNIMVEECTVISLCSFIVQYNRDQKRKVQYDV